MLHLCVRERKFGGVRGYLPIYGMIWKRGEAHVLVKNCSFSDDHYTPGANRRGYSYRSSQPHFGHHPFWGITSAAAGADGGGIRHRHYSPPNFFRSADCRSIHFSISLCLKRQAPPTLK